MTRRLSSLAPGAVVVLLVLGLELAYGVTVGQALLFAAYLLGYVVVPGWLVFRALTARPGGALRQLAFGWALGYVLEILAFMATAATGTRWLFAFYPLLVAGVVGLVFLRRGWTPAKPEPAAVSARLAWVIAAMCGLAVAYVVIAYFPGTQAPGNRDIAYFVDYPRWIALAAEAKHHWPITDPSVSGQPLPYHYFVNIDNAAVSQVTGLGLPLVYFRLFMLPMIVLTGLLMVEAGRSLARSATVGTIAAGLGFFVGELRLNPDISLLTHTAFFGIFFTLLYRSPSFLLGLVFFIPLVVLLGERLMEERRGIFAGEWLVVGLFMIGASDAKVSILPQIVVALGVLGAWRLVRTRRIPSPVWIGGGLAALVFGVVYVLQYAGHSSVFELGPFYVVDQMPAIYVIKGDLTAYVGSFPGKGALLSVGGVLFGLTALLGPPLAGLWWILRDRGKALRIEQEWLFAVLGAGLVLGLFLVEPGTQSGLYFLFYGLVAGFLLSADGLRVAWGEAAKAPSRRAVIVATAIAAIAIAAVILVPGWVNPFSATRELALTYLLRYGAFFCLLAALFLVARRLVSRGAATALVAACFVGIGALATPIDTIIPTAKNPHGAESNLLAKPISPGLYAGLGWIRDNVPYDDVVAVNNQWIDPGNASPLEFQYSAFSEHRIFLEGWGYAQKARDVGYVKVIEGLDPYPGRLALNKAAFEHGSRRALRIMQRDYGVRYLMIDRRYGAYPADMRALSRAGRVVYRDPDVTVVRLDSP